MAGSQLSEDELREAAAEAGISPQELRHALVERDGGALERPPEAAISVLGPPERGMSAVHSEGRVGLPPKDAVSAVRKSIERQTGSSGHNQGSGEADIVDEQSRLTYRIRSQDDGSGGSLVRGDVDPSAGKGYAALTGTAMGGISLTMFALGLLFSATTLAGAGVAMAAVGGFILFRTLAKLGSATKSAKAIASHALMEADDAAARQPKALRSGG